MNCNNSTNIFLIGLISSMKADIRTTNMNQQDLMTFAYAFSVTLLVVFALLSNILSIDTFHQAQLRMTTVGFSLLVYSYCSFIVLLLLEIRLIQLLESLNYAGFISICNVITPLSSILTRSCLWIIGIIALQRALHSFEFGPLWNRIRSRTAVIEQLIIAIVCVALMHIPELISRQVLPDSVAAGRFVCQIKYSPSLLVLNTIFSFIHLFVPVLLNILANCLILASISRRRANLHQQNYWSQWIKQFRRHSHLFISPTLTIFSILPQLILSLEFSCVDITTKWLLRLNIAFALIIHFPQAATFLLFILSSQTYIEVFRTRSYIGKYLCFGQVQRNAVAPLSITQGRPINKTRT